MTATATNHAEALDAAIAERETVAAQLETALMRRALSVYGGGNREHRATEAWGDVVNPNESMAEAGFSSMGCGRHSRADDYKDGDYAPHYRNEQQLAEIRGEAQDAWAGSNMAKNQQGTLAGYVVGEGYTRAAQPKPDSGDRGAEIAKQATEVINEFVERTCLSSEASAEALRRRRVEGEKFQRVRDLGEGFADWRWVEASWVTEPTPSNDVAAAYGLPPGLDWKYGVVTMPGDTETVIGYFVVPYGEKERAELVWAWDMVHGKANVPAGPKRGLPDHYAGGRWLGLGDRVAAFLGESAQIQAAIAIIRKHKQSAVSSNTIEIGGSRVALPPARGGEGARNVPVARYTPGTVLDAFGTDYGFGAVGEGHGESLLKIGEAADQRYGIGVQLPYHMSSGNASNANYASTLVAEAPMTRSCERMQRVETTDEETLLWRVLEIAAEAGRIQASVEELHELIWVTVTAPSVAVRDEKAEADITRILVELGVLSDEGAAERHNIDYAAEQERIEAELKVKKERAEMYGLPTDPQQNQQQPGAKPGDKEPADKNEERDGDSDGVLNESVSRDYLRGLSFRIRK